MEGFLIFLTVFVTLISSVCTALLIPFRQRRLFAKGIPMLVLNILGYALTLFIWAIVPALYYRVGLDTDILFVIPLGIAVVFVVAVVITEFVCGRKNRKEQADEEQPVEEPNAEAQQEQVEEETVEDIQVEPEQLEEAPVVVEEQVETAQPEETVVEPQEESTDDNTDKE